MKALQVQVAVSRVHKLMRHSYHNAKDALLSFDELSHLAPLSQACNDYLWIGGDILCNAFYVIPKYPHVIYFVHGLRLLTPVSGDENQISS
ncbi:hypothetical protein E2C01_028940 [Portunus trituberculatus]|uniref:Uncharacterized protein n=1 Tax=Portunus trituberculatus TaxID=210409 RepID=A0A5B7EQ41_PORTR|nr:hypothetical protein [Portunus trituberculatus]